MRGCYRATALTCFWLIIYLFWELHVIMKNFPDYRLLHYETDLVVQCEQEREMFNNTSTNLCPCIPSGLHGRTIPDTNELLEMTWGSAEHVLFDSGLGPGGHWKPTNCTARRRVAIIIAYRDRERHLRAFLVHIHPILQRQLLEYKIFVVEQDYPYVFNKGSMMNIGFLESQKSFKHDCVLFHDVDLLMENDRHMIVCSPHVQHMGAFIDYFDYKIWYKTLIGGAVLVSRNTFTAMNGYSNNFFGWGGEDDDLEKRLKWQNKAIIRAPGNVATYSSLKHSSDLGNPKAADRLKVHTFRPELYALDGLNSVKYTVLQNEEYALYTWLHVQLIETMSNSVFFNKTVEFKMKQAKCSPKPEGDHLELSRATCTYLCMGERSCVGFYYNTNTNRESYCVMLKQRCRGVMPSNTAEIHLKRLDPFS